MSAPDWSTPTPSRGTADHRKRWLALIIAAVLLVSIGGTVVVLNAVGAFGVKVDAEPDNTPGPNPYMPPAGSDTPTQAQPNTGRQFPGDTAGLYGGTLNSATCDPDKMITFLQANPDKAAAWAGVEGIQAADIPNYIHGLTPLILRSDAAVTNHGFADGQATTRDAVLEAGTAVLVDRYGVPRSKCECGNPLTPRRSYSRARFTGPTWPGFTENNITIINQSVTVINVFVIVNIYNNTIIYRPAGTHGDQDRQQPSQQPPSAPPTTAPSTPSPATNPIAGSWTLSRNLSTCENLPDGCSAAPFTLRIDNCSESSCSMARTDGTWRSSHPLTRSGSTWSAQFTDIGVTCHGQRNQASFTWSLAVDETGSALSGQYSYGAGSNPPDCPSDPSVSFTFTGERS